MLAAAAALAAATPHAASCACSECYLRVRLYDAEDRYLRQRQELTRVTDENLALARELARLREERDIAVRREERTRTCRGCGVVQTTPAVLSEGGRCTRCFVEAMGLGTEAA